MKIAFLGVRVPGHPNPTTTLGRQLQARNHEIIFPYSSRTGGLPFISGLEKDHVNKDTRQMSKIQGDHAVEFSLRMLLAQMETILKSLPATVTVSGGTLSFIVNP